MTTSASTARFERVRGGLSPLNELRMREVHQVCVCVRVLSVCVLSVCVVSVCVWLVCVNVSVCECECA